MIEPKISKLISLARQNLTNSEPKLRKYWYSNSGFTNKPRQCLSSSTAVRTSLRASAKHSKNWAKNTTSSIRPHSWTSKAQRLTCTISWKAWPTTWRILPHILRKTFTDQSEMIYKHFYGTFKYECINMMSMAESLGKLEMPRSTVTTRISCVG